MILPGYWHTESRDVASFNRNQRRFNCVSDITFKEFIHYITNSKTTNNGHWIPIHKLCNPCKWDFDYIGKQETFMEDTKLIFHHFNLTHMMKNRNHLENMIFQTRSQSEYVFSIASYKNEICNKSLEFIARRLWYAYQIQGYIRKTSQFKMPILKRRELTGDMFQKIVENEIVKNSLTKRESSNQRKYFLHKAYSKIPLSLIADIQREYKLDFKLFGYSFDSYHES
ncbi:carbohydrate sulfotransferase 11-like [Argonauta hians]